MHPAAGRQFPKGPRGNSPCLGKPFDHAHVIVSVDKQRIHPPTDERGNEDHDQQRDAAECIDARGRHVIDFICLAHGILLHQIIDELADGEPRARQLQNRQEKNTVDQHPGKYQAGKGY